MLTERRFPFCDLEDCTSMERRLELTPAFLAPLRATALLLDMVFLRDLRVFFPVDEVFEWLERSPIMLGSSERSSSTDGILTEQLRSLPTGVKPGTAIEARVDLQ